MQFGALPLKRLDGAASFLSVFSFPKHGSKIAVMFGFILIALFFLAGCASQKGMVSDADYMSLLPEDAEIYLCFPVQDNPSIAGELVAAFAPQMEVQDIKKLTKRFDTIYGAVKGKEFSAVATGSFPKLGLGFALKEKNGWKKIKDSAVPVTGSFYQYKNLPFQIAFPSSSLMMIAPQVDSLLNSYQQQLEGSVLVAENPFAQFVSDHEQAFIGNATLSDSNPTSTSIDFYVSDVVSIILPLLKTSLPINLPFTDLYGSFIPERIGAQGEEGYSFVAYVGLSDARVMKASLATLKFVARGLGIELEYSSVGEETIKISGITLSQKDLGDLLKKIL